jgi:hypothetical protein
VGEDLEMEVVLNGFSSQGIIQYYKFTWTSQRHIGLY